MGGPRGGPRSPALKRSNVLFVGLAIGFAAVTVLDAAALQLWGPIWGTRLGLVGVALVVTVSLAIFVRPRRPPRVSVGPGMDFNPLHSGNEAEEGRSSF